MAFFAAEAVPANDNGHDYGQHDEMLDKRAERNVLNLRKMLNKLFDKRIRHRPEH